MNIKPMPANTGVTQVGQTQQTGNPDARARAIAKLTQATPVQNPSQVQPEEMGAIMAHSGTDESQDAEESLEATTDTTDEGQPDIEATEPEPEAKAEDPALSSQFAAIARREKALRAQALKQDQAIKQREAALAAREAEMQSKAPDLTKYISKDELLRNPLKVMNETGLSYEELTNQILNQGAMDPRVEATISKMEAKIQALEQSLEQAGKSQKDQQDQAYKAAVKQIETDAKRLVFTDPAYEMIKATNSVRDIVELIEAEFNKSGEVLSVEEAAQQVEDYLTEEAEKLARIEKIKKRLAPAVNAQVKATAVKTPAAQTATQQPQMKTLTNTNSSTRPLTPKERAILAFKGELK